MSGAGEKGGRPRRGRAKRVLFRVMAVLLALSPFVAAEALCRVFDWGRPTQFDDPFAGFSDIHPLFVLNEDTGRYEIPPSRQTHFRPESFLADKPADEYRIFVLGGSTVQGRPYAIETAFPTFLELDLKAADPTRRWEVVNCGGISYASYRLVPILEEVLGYGPDLVIVCTGHNEFLEDRTYGHIKHAPALLSWPQRQAARLRTFTLLRAGWYGLWGEDEGKGRPMLSPEADARLDWRGGMEEYHRDEEWRRGVIDHYEFSLRRMQALAEKAGVPLWFMVPVSNLEWPPFKSEHRDGLSAGEEERFVELREQAKARYGSSLPDALARLESAAEIDDRYALVHFEIGKCLQLMGRLHEARGELIRAKEEDVCPLRMLEPMKERMHRVAEETDTPLIDADALFASRSRGGIPGREWLVDHVHPTIGGHRLLGDVLAEELARRGVVVPESGWEARREKLCQDHLDGLPALYFAQGELRMKAVQRWARGQATRERKGGKE
jgi:hypothetical protein